MTNREAILKKMTDMSVDDLADYLETGIGEDISLLICHQCQCKHNGDCLMESLHLDYCPKNVSDWLKEEAC